MVVFFSILPVLLRNVIHESKLIRKRKLLPMLPEKWEFAREIGLEKVFHFFCCKKERQESKRKAQAEAQRLAIEQLVEETTCEWFLFDCWVWHTLDRDDHEDEFRALFGDPNADRMDPNDSGKCWR